MQTKIWASEKIWYNRCFIIPPGGLLLHQMLTHFDLYSKLLTG